MKTVIFCEGTTDLMMIQFVLQYKYGWKYDGFIENSITNKLQLKTLKNNDDIVEIQSCGGMMNIPNLMRKAQDKMEFATKREELYDKVIVLIDHDETNTGKEFIDKVNEKLQTNFTESDININTKFSISNLIMGEITLDLFIKSLPETETGAIEKVMLEALSTDQIEEMLIDDSDNFIREIAQKQDRYLNKKSLIPKAIFNTYFAIRAPEEKYDERAKILNAYDWKNNDVLNSSFEFLDILNRY